MYAPQLPTWTPLFPSHLDAAIENAQSMTRRAQGTPIRLASKSIRIRELIGRILDLPGYQGILAFNLDEAMWLVESGTCDDVLVAYPSANRESLHRLLCDPICGIESP